MEKFSVLAVMDASVAVDVDPLSVVELFRIAADHSLIRVSDGRRFEGPMPPWPCLALVGWSQSSAVFLQSVQTLLGAGKVGLKPDVVILTGVPSWQSVLAGAFHGLERLLQEQSRHVVRLSGELADLRRQHETEQEGFRALEQFFLERNVSLVEEAFVNEPQVPFDFPCPADESDRPAIRQQLPTSTRLLSGFSLHVAETDASTSGTLSVAVLCPELDEILWRWRVPLGSLPRGWVTFGLPRTRGGIAKTAIVELALEDSRDGFRLSAGPPNPLPQYRIMTSEHGPSSERSLAVRTFVSPPMVAISHDASTVLPVGQEWRDRRLPDFAAIRSSRVDPAHLSQVRAPESTCAAQKTCPLPRFLAERNAIELEPFGSSATVAIVPGCLPSAATSVSVDIQVVPPGVGGIGVRIGAFPDDRPPDNDALLAMADSGLECVDLSDWVFLSHGRRQSLSVTCKNRFGPKGGSIVLVARLPDDVAGAGATATLSSIRFETG